MERQNGDNLPLLKINLDETRVQFWNQGGQGNVYCCRGSVWQSCGEYASRASTFERKLALTHVGVIANRREVNVVLPQVLLVQRYHLSRDDLERIRAILPDNIMLLEGSSNWMSEEYMLKIIDLLAHAVASVGQFHVVFIMDTFATHVSINVIAKLQLVGFNPVYVPASCTWLLQPLDVAVFGRFKRAVQQAVRSARVQASGNISRAAWVEAVVTTIQRVIVNEPWAASFLEVGLGARQAFVSQYILDQCALGAPPGEDLGAITDADVANIMPKGRCFPAALLYFVPAGHPHMPPALDDDFDTLFGDVFDDGPVVPLGLPAPADDAPGDDINSLLSLWSQDPLHFP